MMDCRTASLLIEAYHDDELGLVDAAHLLAHLEECDACRSRCDEAARLREAVRAGKPVDRCPEELARRLARRVEWPGRPRRFLRPVVAIVGSCGILVGWAAARVLPVPFSGAWVLRPAARTFDADVFCLQCALHELFPDRVADAGPHRPILRTADGRIWVVSPASPARSRFPEAGAAPRHVVVTAALDERSGTADVTDLATGEAARPAAR